MNLNFQNSLFLCDLFRNNECSVKTQIWKGEGCNAVLIKNFRSTLDNSIFLI